MRNATCRCPVDCSTQSSIGTRRSGGSSCDWDIFFLGLLAFDFRRLPSLSEFRQRLFPVALCGEFLGPAGGFAGLLAVLAPLPLDAGEFGFGGQFGHCLLSFLSLIVRRNHFSTALASIGGISARRSGRKPLMRSLPDHTGNSSGTLPQRTWDLI